MLTTGVSHPHPFAPPLAGQLRRQAGLEGRWRRAPGQRHRKALSKGNSSSEQRPGAPAAETELSALLLILETTSSGTCRGQSKTKEEERGQFEKKRKK